MPFEVIDSVDPLSKFVQFRTSPVYELLISIQTLLNPPRHHQEWAEQAASALPASLLAELTALYREYSDGNMYLELPVDYRDAHHNNHDDTSGHDKNWHDNVEGFFRYVRELDDADFVFYLVGRIIRRDQIAQLLPDRDAVRQSLGESLSTSSELFERYGQYLDAILSDLQGFRERLVQAWETYWTVYFRAEVGQFVEAWKTGIQERKVILQREGGRVLMEKVTGRVDFPPELPPGMPLTSITFIPVYLLPSRVYRFYGYGNITVLFDPQFTEARKQVLEQGKNEAIATIRALDDENRLKILRLIAQQDGVLHGKVIAERLGISASAVSRHLALLKEGGLIVEEPHKNVTTYRFQKHALGGLVDKLLDYLGS